MTTTVANQLPPNQFGKTVNVSSALRNAVDKRIAAVNGVALVRNLPDDSGMPNFLIPTVIASVASRWWQESR